MENIKPEQIVVVLNSLHLIIGLLVFVIGIGIQIGLMIAFKNDTKLKIQDHEKRLDILEDDSKVLNEITINLKRLFKQQNLDYIEGRRRNE